MLAFVLVSVAAAGPEGGRALAVAAGGASGAGAGGASGAATAGAGGATSPFGRWFDAPAYPYRVRLDAVANCRAGSQAKAEGAKHEGAEVPTKLIGFTVTVSSKIGLLWAFSRDVTLENRGVILQSLPARKPEIPGCAPALQSKQLDKGDSARGVVVFEVPATFVTGPDDSVVLAYKATRWGGAPRIEMPVPACLGSCAQAGRPGKGAIRQKR